MAELQVDIEESRLGATEMIRQIVGIFSHREFTLDGPNAELAARQLVSNQTNIHKEVISIAFMNVAKGRSKWLVPFHAELNNFIDRLALESRYEIKNTDTAALVRSNFAPVLRTEDSSTINEIWSRSPISAVEKGEVLVASYLRATREIVIDGRPQPLPDLGKRIDFAIARIEAVWIADTSSSETAYGIHSAAEEMITAAREKYAATAVALEENFETIRRQNAKLNEQTKLILRKTAELESSVNKSAVQVDALREDFVAKYDATETATKAFMEAVRTEANFEGLKAHWNDRAKASFQAFAGSAAVLIILLALLPGYLIVNSDQIITFMRHLADVATVDVGPDPSAATLTVATISRLLIVTIPVALYFWAIKLVVRFNMRSMMLMDDARQRSTMLETYYRMIEKSAATREDRALVLQALMRPAPGHGPDTVEPPSFTEVIDKAIGRQGT